MKERKGDTKKKKKRERSHMDTSAWTPKGDTSYIVFALRVYE